MCHIVTVLQHLFAQGSPTTVNTAQQVAGKVADSEFLKGLFKSRFFATLDITEIKALQEMIEKDIQPPVKLYQSLRDKGMIRKDGKNEYVPRSPLVFDVFAHHFLLN